MQRVAAAAAAGGGGSTLLQDMPEFLLPYLLYLLAHHPDYPSPEVCARLCYGGGQYHMQMGGGRGCAKEEQGRAGVALARRPSRCPSSHASPDYVTSHRRWQVLAEFEQADEEERQEVYGPGGTPFTPFVGMLQVLSLCGRHRLEGEGVCSVVKAQGPARLLTRGLHRAGGHT